MGNVVTVIICLLPIAYVLFMGLRFRSGIIRDNQRELKRLEGMGYTIHNDTVYDLDGNPTVPR